MDVSKSKSLRGINGGWFQWLLGQPVTEPWTKLAGSFISFFDIKLKILQKI